MRRALLYTVAFWAALLPTYSAPTAREVLDRFLAASQDPHLEARRNSFAYQRSSTVEHLDDNDACRKQVVRLYEITPGQLEPVTRLVSVNGRPAMSKDESRKSAARETGDKTRGLDISPDLLARYDFKLLPEPDATSRPVFALAFTPGPNAPNDAFFDRFLNAVEGTLYIDAEDYQLVQANIRLRDKISFFGGIGGAIEKMDCVFVQKRVEPGVWLPMSTFIDFRGRKLLSEVRFRCYESCSGFRPDK